VLGAISTRTLTETILQELEGLTLNENPEGKRLIIVVDDRERTDPLEMLLRFKESFNIDRLVLSDIYDDDEPRKQTVPGFLSKIYPVREEICLSREIKIFLIKRNKGPPAPCFFYLFQKQKSIH